MTLSPAINAAVRAAISSAAASKTGSAPCMYPRLHRRISLHLAGNNARDVALVADNLANDGIRKPEVRRQTRKAVTQRVGRQALNWRERLVVDVENQFRPKAFIPRAKLLDRLAINIGNTQPNRRAELQ